MNKKLKNAAKDFYDRSSLTSKIRYSYLVILIPIFLFLLFCFYNLWAANYRYQDMINSTVAASEFTLDFKKDFDYETYLLIVGNKTVEESELRGYAYQCEPDHYRIGADYGFQRQSCQIKEY